MKRVMGWVVVVVLILLVASEGRAAPILEFVEGKPVLTYNQEQFEVEFPVDADLESMTKNAIVTAFKNYYANHWFEAKEVAQALGVLAATPDFGEGMFAPFLEDALLVFVEPGTIPDEERAAIERELLFYMETIEQPTRMGVEFLCALTWEAVLIEESKAAADLIQGWRAKDGGEKIGPLRPAYTMEGVINSTYFRPGLERAFILAGAFGAVPSDQVSLFLRGETPTTEVLKQVVDFVAALPGFENDQYLKPERIVVGYLNAHGERALAAGNTQEAGDMVWFLGPLRLEEANPIILNAINTDSFHMRRGAIRAIAESPIRTMKEFLWVVSGEMSVIKGVGDHILSSHARPDMRLRLNAFLIFLFQNGELATSGRVEILTSLTRRSVAIVDGTILTALLRSVKKIETLSTLLWGSEELVRGLLSLTIHPDLKAKEAREGKQILTKLVEWSDGKPASNGMSDLLAVISDLVEPNGDEQKVVEGTQFDRVKRVVGRMTFFHKPVSGTVGNADPQVGDEIIRSRVKHVAETTARKTVKK